MHIQNNIICHLGSSVSIAMAITGFIINLIVVLLCPLPEGHYKMMRV